MLHLYRQALAARRSSPALRQGTFRWVDAPDGVLAWERALGPERVLVAVNMTGSPARLDAAAGGWSLLVSSDGGGFSRELRPDSAVWLARP